MKFPKDSPKPAVVSKPSTDVVLTEAEKLEFLLLRQKLVTLVAERTACQNIQGFAQQQ